MAANFGERVTAALNAKGVRPECTQCGANAGWEHVGDLQGALLLSDANQAGIDIGSNLLPIAVLICKNCGFVAQHARSALGL